MSRSKYLHRSEDEWMQLIQECRASGLSDAAWCNHNGIPSSSFYNAVQRCRKRACTVPEIKAPVLTEGQAVVPVSFSEPATIYPDYHISEDNSISPVVQIVVNDYKIQISQNCEKSTIANVLLALRELC